MMSPVGVPAAAAATDEAVEAVLKWPPVLITTTPANIKYIKVMNGKFNAPLWPNHRVFLGKMSIQNTF